MSRENGWSFLIEGIRKQREWKTYSQERGMGSGSVPKAKKILKTLGTD